MTLKIKTKVKFLLKSTKNKQKAWNKIKISENDGTEQR